MNKVVLYGKELTPKDIAERAISFIKSRDYRVHKAIITARYSITHQKSHEIRKFIKECGDKINLLANKLALKKLQREYTENKRVMISWFFEIENIVRETLSIENESKLQG